MLWRGEGECDTGEKRCRAVEAYSFTTVDAALQTKKWRPDPNELGRRGSIRLAYFD
jgi:hypothetical protein